MSLNQELPKMLLGLIGSGIQQSLTPAMQMREASHHGIDAHYQIIDLDLRKLGIDVLPNLVDSMKTIGFSGFNVTFPCKQAIIPLLDELSEEAKAMGAVNTVINRNGKLIGHNTDGSGWSRGFIDTLPHADLSKVVLLGAGGAGSAIAHAALRLGVKSLVVVDTDAQRCESLVNALNTLYGQRSSYSLNIAEALKGATGLIHATPTGMTKLPGLPLPENLITSNLWVSEVVYFPIETELLKIAKAKGCQVVNGGTMAVGQAVGAFELFTGKKADAKRVEKHFLSLLN
jgi:shikimate dehydrogenase